MRPAPSQAFGTPNVVHFGIVLFLSTLIAAPWESLIVVSILWGIVGFGGVIYAIIVGIRMRSQTAYHPVVEDWLSHFLLPLTAYILLTVSAGTVFLFPRPSLFLVGAASLLLLFIGIHNAWDTVTYQVYTRKRKQREKEGTNAP